MFANPVEKGTFEADIVAQSFRFQPLVSQDLFPLGEKFLIEA